MSLEPAIGTLSGLVLLHEALSPVQLAAVAAIVAASVGAAATARVVAEPPPT
jgi:inner membrane transporter RhtA